MADIGPLCGEREHQSDRLRCFALEGQHLHVPNKRLIHHFGNSGGQTMLYSASTYLKSPINLSTRWS
jgi:hypothetical protein